MTKEGLEKYARDHRKELDAQEVKLGDVVKVLVGQFAGETGIVIGIIACDKSDYTDPYYEIALNCEVPEKYKCRKTLITPNNVAGGFAAHDFEVIGNRAPKQPSMEIKQGDKVRVSKDAPELYTMYGQTDWESVESTVEKIDGDAAEIKWFNENSDEYDYITIPTKYLIKVDAEAKEAKFKCGDKVRILSLHGRPTPDKGAVDVIAHINIGNREQMYYLEKHYHCAFGFSESDLEPYTKPTEAEKESNVGSIKIPVEVDFKEVAKEYAEAMSNAIREYGDALCKHGTFIRMVDDLYKRDLAKELALKVANKFNTPHEAAEYAVKVAKEVVEGLKRK